MCGADTGNKTALCPLEETWYLNAISSPRAGDLTSQAPLLAWLPFFPDAKERKQEKVVFL